MKAVLLRLLGAALAIAGLCIVGGCEIGGIVGGECRPGAIVCDGRCVDPRNDSEHCGACDEVCSSGIMCVDAICSGPIGAGGERGIVLHGSGGSGGSTASGGSAGNGEAGSWDGGSVVLDPPGTVIGGASCEAPQVACGDECIDTATDGSHCGRCFNACPTGLCQAGSCVGTIPGHIVLVCMSYAQGGSNAPQNVLLANAVFLPLKNPVRMLAFTAYADPQTVDRVDRVIEQGAEQRRREYRITHSNDSSDVIAQLSHASYDVLLVYDQPKAPAGALADIGSSWAGAMDAFLSSGGTTIVLSGGGSMPELISNANLLAVGATENATSSTLYNRAPTDAIGLNVLSPFLALRDSCTFETDAEPSSGSNTVFVVTDSAPRNGLGKPVVLHRIHDD